VYLNRAEIATAGLRKGDLVPGARRVLVKRQAHYPAYVNKTQLRAVQRLRRGSGPGVRVPGAPACAKAYAFGAASGYAVLGARPGTNEFKARKLDYYKKTKQLNVGRAFLEKQPLSFQMFYHARSQHHMPARRATV
jgi:hypothetical protein